MFEIEDDDDDGEFDVVDDSISSPTPSSTLKDPWLATDPWKQGSRFGARSRPNPIPTPTYSQKELLDLEKWLAQPISVPTPAVFEKVEDDSDGFEIVVDDMPESPPTSNTNPTSDIAAETSSTDPPPTLRSSRVSHRRMLSKTQRKNVQKRTRRTQRKLMLAEAACPLTCGPLVGVGVAEALDSKD